MRVLVSMIAVVFSGAALIADAANDAAAEALTNPQVKVAGKDKTRDTLEAKSDADVKNVARLVLAR